MGSLPTLIVLEQSKVLPPPTTPSPKSLPLTFFDIAWLALTNPVHSLFFYDLPITQTQFNDTIVPKLKQSLSTTLKHFFPFAGNLIICPKGTTKPEIRYIEGDSVAVTFAQCHLDFNDLTGNHPRECDNFYHLIPLLGRTTKVSDCVAIPVFAVQVTFFPNYGISIGITNHHSLCDASARFCFLKAWASIAQSGSDMSFLANGTLPIYDRLVKNSKLDETYLKKARIEYYNESYEVPRLSGPTDKVRATFILTRTLITGLKKLVSSELPKLAYVSSFTIACAYIWSCAAKLHDNDKLALFCVPINCRSRMNPPIPDAYFGNCIQPCITLERITNLKERDGFLTAAKLIGENLHKTLTDKDGIVKDLGPNDSLFREDWPRTRMAVSGAAKLRFYDLSFGFGKPLKYEVISIDYYNSISITASRESSEDLEIGVCLPATEMDVFVRNFKSGLESYV